MLPLIIKFFHATTIHNKPTMIAISVPNSEDRSANQLDNHQYTHPTPAHLLQHFQHLFSSTQLNEYITIQSLHGSNLTESGSVQPCVANFAKSLRHASQANNFNQTTEHNWFPPCNSPPPFAKPYDLPSLNLELFSLQILNIQTIALFARNHFVRGKTTDGCISYVKQEGTFQLNFFSLL